MRAPSESDGGRGGAKRAVPSPRNVPYSASNLARFGIPASHAEHS